MNEVAQLRAELTTQRQQLQLMQQRMEQLAGAACQKVLRRGTADEMADAVSVVEVPEQTVAQTPLKSDELTKLSWSFIGMKGWRTSVLRVLARGDVRTSGFHLLETLWSFCWHAVYVAGRLWKGRGGGLGGACFVGFRAMPGRLPSVIGQFIFKRLAFRELLRCADVCCGWCTTRLQRRLVAVIRELTSYVLRVVVQCRCGERI